MSDGGRETGIANREGESRLRSLEWRVREHSPCGEWTEWTLELADEYVRAGKHAEAAALLGAVRCEFPQPEAYTLQGKALLAGGAAGAAVAPLEAAIRHFPGDLALRLSCGQACLAAGWGDAALDRFREACALAPWDPRPTRFLAQALFRLERRGEAASLLSQACASDSGASRPELWAGLGWVLLHLGKHADAWKALRRSLELKPGDLQCLKSLALASFALGRKEESLHSYECVLQIRPDDAESHFGIGLLHLSGGNPKGAYQRYEILKALNSPLAGELQAKILEIQGH
jgi:tetratricopeptide (TPR) repeat protein